MVQWSHRRERVDGAIQEVWEAKGLDNAAASVSINRNRQAGAWDVVVVLKVGDKMANGTAMAYPDRTQAKAGAKRLMKQLEAQIGPEPPAVA